MCILEMEPSRYGLLREKDALSLKWKESCLPRFFVVVLEHARLSDFPVQRRDTCLTPTKKYFSFAQANRSNTQFVNFKNNVSTMLVY